MRGRRGIGMPLAPVSPPGCPLFCLFAQPSASPLQVLSLSLSSPLAQVGPGSALPLAVLALRPSPRASSALLPSRPPFSPAFPHASPSPPEQSLLPLYVLLLFMSRSFPPPLASPPTSHFPLLTYVGDPAPLHIDLTVPTLPPSPGACLHSMLG